MKSVLLNIALDDNSTVNRKLTISADDIDINTFKGKVIIRFSENLKFAYGEEAKEISLIEFIKTFDACYENPQMYIESNDAIEFVIVDGMRIMML